MKKYLLLLLTLLLLLPINVVASTCEPDKITIESINLESKSGGAQEKEEASITGKKINLNLHMEDVGDKAEYKIVVKNGSDYNYELKGLTLDLDSNYINYSISTDDDSDIVPARSIKEVHLKVEYKESVPVEDLSQGTYNDNKTVQLGMVSDSKPVPTPTPTPTGIPTPTEQPVNNDPINVPNTFANSNTILLVIVLILFAVAIYYYRRNKVVVVSLSVLLVILLISSKSSFALCSTSLSIESKIEIEYQYSMFKTGPEVNLRMRQFVDPTADFDYPDFTITKIRRYTNVPDNRYLIESNIVSTAESTVPIYMWYDSDSTTVYWYTKAKDVFYNQDASGFYYGLAAIDSESISNDINSKYTEDMSGMFIVTGASNESFKLALGSNFDTSNVTNMGGMFDSTGWESPVFTLDLGPNFDTSNVIYMDYMFSNTGYSSPIFTLDLGNKFDTSNVYSMNSMFSYTGYSSQVFTLDLGNKFDTSSVEEMSQMFYKVGYGSPVFTLDLGPNFDTSGVRNMGYMFNYAGYSSLVFTLDLGDKFNTSNAIMNMNSMFAYAGYNSPVFTLNLGNKFNTSQINDMSYMFAYLGRSNPNFVLDLGPLFDTNAASNMTSMFEGDNTLKTIYAPDSFVVTYVTSSSNMFANCNNLVGGKGTVWNSTIINKTRARIDEGTTRPGYFTKRYLAEFDTGKVVNAKIKQLIDSNATYESRDESIKNIIRYTGDFDSELLDKSVIVSSSNSQNPIYMWYNEETSVIEWYTAGTDVYYNQDSSYFYYGLETIERINSLSQIKSVNVTNMESMFAYVGYNSNDLYLDLNVVGNLFDTNNVINMRNMFSHLGYNSSNFYLNLGFRFGTYNVTNMNGMFEGIGYSSDYPISLNIESFDTSNVKDMRNMFKDARYLKKLEVYNSFFIGPDTETTDMFLGCLAIEGSEGTTYDPSHTDGSYARIDGGTTNPGYLYAHEEINV